MNSLVSYQKVCGIIAASTLFSLFGSCSGQTSDGMSANAAQMSSSTLPTSSSPSSVIAQKDGYVLTERHFQKSVEIVMATDGLTALPIADQLALKAGVTQAFYDDPQGVLAKLDQTHAQVTSPNGVAGGAQGAYQQDRYPRPSGSSLGSSESGIGMGSSAGQNVAAGHQQLRQNLQTLAQRSGSGMQFTAQSFNAPSVQQLRAFTANSQWVNKTSSEYYYGTTTYTFCADGTFRYYNNSSMSVGASTPGNGGYEDAHALSSGEGTAHGYWDAYNENGNDAILVFSADPAFAEESMNYTGMMAYPIATYQHDVVQFGQRGQAANVDTLVRRRAISGCS